MKTPRSCWPTARLLVSCLIFPLPSVKAQFVDLRAEIEVDQWTPRGVTRWPTAFRCVVGTNSWQMEGDFSRNARITFWFTGTNIVEHSVVTKQPSDEFLKRVNHPGFPAASFPPIGSQSTRVFSSPSGTPGRPVRQADLLTMTARIGWLAFCSGPYLKREEREVFPPSDLWKELILTQRFSDKTVTFDDSLGLPKAIDLYTATSQPVVQYRVTSSTNVMGWEFPLDFVVVQYRPAPLPENPWVTTGTNGWELEFTARGKVLAAVVGAEPQIPAEVWRTVDQ